LNDCPFCAGCGDETGLKIAVAVAADAESHTVEGCGDEFPSLVAKLAGRAESSRGRLQGMGRLGMLGCGDISLTSQSPPNIIKVMSIWNKILVGFILLGALGVIYQSAVVLKINEHWRVAIKQHKERLAQVEEENVLLVEADRSSGEDVALGIRQLKIDRHRLLVNRGRVWRECEAAAKPGAMGITITVDEPDPHNIATDSILYAFEEIGAAEGGRYIGEFVVKGVDAANNQVVIEPTCKLTAEQGQLIGSALKKGTWTLYDTMPLDNHYVFADVEEDVLRAALPEDTAEEYIADAKVAKEAQDANLMEKPEYPRKLRSYSVLFSRHKTAREAAKDRLTVLERDNKYLDGALANAKKQVDFRKQEIVEMTARRDAFRRDVAAINAHGRLVYAKLKAIQATVAKLIVENDALAAEITEKQIAARDMIDAKTRRLADTAGRTE